MSTLDALKTEFEQFLTEFETFDVKGNKAAGTRARKNLLEVGKLTKTMRVEIQERKNSV